MKMLKRAAAILLLAAMVLSLGATALAADFLCYTTGSVHVRKGPGLNYKSVTTLKKGTALDAYEGKYDERGVLWVRVVGKNNVKGWVSTANLKKGKPIPTKYMVKADKGSVVIRSYPSTEAKNLGTLSKGKKASYLQERYTDWRGVDWYKVTYKGIKGWVSSMYTSIA